MNVVTILKFNTGNVIIFTTFESYSYINSTYMDILELLLVRKALNGNSNLISKNFFYLSVLCCLTDVVNLTNIKPTFSQANELFSLHYLITINLATLFYS